MALKITDLTGNTTAPIGTYPFGDIINQPNGTLVDKAMMDDILQTMQAIMANAGVTPNSTPDNASNGYQICDALSTLISPPFSSAGITFATVTSNTWGNVGSPYYNAGYKAPIGLGFNNNEVALCGTVSNAGIPPGTIPILTLPSNARPSMQVQCVVWAEINSTLQAAKLTIDTSGVVSIDSPGTSASIVCLDGVRFRIA